MGTRMLPSKAEVEDLLPGPDSITWRRAADARTLIAAGYALVLQVSHPTVGIGVAEHSNYREDPWGRLLRTLDFTNTLIYGGGEVAGTAAHELRARHARIRGARPDGTRYHALEPSAYAWVWATLYNAIVCAHARFGEPLAEAQQEQFWAEWRRLGRIIGIAERDLPATLAGYAGYFDAIVHDMLADNETVQGVLASLAAPACPLPRYLQPAWRIGRLPGAHALRLATAGLLPPLLRERFGLRWTHAQELELRAVGAASRAATPLMPRTLRMFGPSYLRLRAGSTQRPARAPDTKRAA